MCTRDIQAIAHIWNFLITVQAALISNTVCVFNFNAIIILCAIQLKCSTFDLNFLNPIHKPNAVYISNFYWLDYCSDSRENIFRSRNWFGSFQLWVRQPFYASSRMSRFWAFFASNWDRLRTPKSIGYFGEILNTIANWIDSHFTRKLAIQT